MPKKYKVVTEKGTFIVETDEPSQDLSNYQSPRYGHTGPTGLQVASDQAANVLKGIPRAITGIPGMLSQGAGAIGQALTGGGTGQGMDMLKGMAQPFMTAAQGAGALAAPSSVQAPSDQDWSQAAQGAGAQLGAGLLGAGTSALGNAIASRIPDTARAAGNFQTVMGAAKDVPLDLTAADQVMQRANELRQRGGTLPKVMRDYMRQRGANPDMTYEAGRDFATSAGALSGREATALNAPMQRQVGQFAAALKDANREAAASVGMGDLYDQAMKEYRQAKTLGTAADIAKKFVTRAALGAALTGGGAAGYDIYRTLRGER